MTTDITQNYIDDLELSLEEVSLLNESITGNKGKIDKEILENIANMMDYIVKIFEDNKPLENKNILSLREIILRIPTFIPEAEEELNGIKEVVEGKKSYLQIIADSLRTIEEGTVEAIEKILGDQEKKA